MRQLSGMRWNEPTLEAHFTEIPAILQQMAKEFDGFSRAYGVEAVVIHVDRWEVSFRDAHGGARLYSPEQVKELCELVNTLYARKDGKPTLTHASSVGGDSEFRLRAPFNTALFMVPPSA